MGVAADAQAAAQLANAERFQGIFIDLADDGLDVTEFFAGLKPGQPAFRASTPVIAFGSHVATSRLQAARDAGCTEVMPRSRFSADLPELLTQYCHTGPAA